MSNCPQHCNPILLIERIACVNEEKSPFFFHAVRLPHVIDGMNSTFDSRFQACTELVDTAGFFGFLPCHVKKTFCE
jgi:hypothetical protein